MIKSNKCIKMIGAALVSACMLGAFSACQSGEKLPEIGKGVALFDYFNYKGEDDFYKENPLPDASSFYNPILPGWYSDPSVCTNGEDYFLVTSTFTYFPGVPIFHSKDMVNWKQIGNVLDRPSQLVKMEGQHVSGGIFAPAIEYNPHNKTYYMVTTNVGAGNFFVKTQDPFGEWSDPIMLPEVGGIDPSFFFDDDGKAYVVNNDAPLGEPEYDGHRVIMVQEFDVNADKTVGPRKILVNKGARPEESPIWIEGPHMYKINGKYFLMSAEGGTSVWHSEVIFRGESPMGPFKVWDKSPILTQRHLDKDRPNPITCAGHADLIQTKEGDWWGVFLACRPIDNKFENLGRETFMMPVQWTEDGFPYMTQGDDVIPMISRREGVTRDDAECTFGNFERNEDFSSETLGMEWMTLRTPVTDLYSLTETSGYLTLKCADVKSSERKAPAFVCRRMQHHKFECDTRMLFNPSDNNEKAGMLLFKDEAHQYYMYVGQNGEERYIALEQIGKENKELAKQDIANTVKAIELKVVSTGLTYEFYYATKKGEWALLAKDVDAKYLSTATAGGFTGTTIGMYATRAN